MTTVSSPKELSAFFSDANNDFPAIIGKPSVNDVQRLCQRKFSALQDIDLGDGTDATGLILSEVGHKAAIANQVFDQAGGALEAYNPSIWDDENNADPLRQEKKWSRKLNLQAAIRTAERVGNKFVLSRVEEMWLVFLKNETTLFKHITLRNILDHLRATSTGCEAIDVIGLQQGMLSWWVKYPRVPEFITRCEEVQRKARRASLAISDVWIVAVAFSPSSQKKKSLTNDLSLKGYRDSTGLGKSGSLTSKPRRSRSNVSSDTPTPPRIPWDWQTLPRSSIGSRTMETPCSQQ